MTYVDIECFHCKITIAKPLKDVKRNQKRGNYLYCSIDCYQKSRNQRAAFGTNEPKTGLILKQCSVCGADTWRDLYHVNRNKTGLFFCTKDCRTSHYGSSNWSTRKKAFEIFGILCVGCGENREYRLTVHHIDGNDKNNDISNWEIVCYNCHVIRHLKQVGGKWKVDFAFLTPRNLLVEL